MNYKFLAIINDYCHYRNKAPDTWLKHCKNQKSINKAISVAALSVNHLNERHQHQYKLKQNDLDNFEKALLSNEEMIQKAESFDDLHRIIKKIGEEIAGSGEMLIYDSTERLGNYKNLFPKKIYLHAGTRVGAEKLLARKIKTEVIIKDQLPEEFDSLTCSEIEDILCMYKNRLSTL